MRTIYKYPLAVTSKQTIQVPVRSIPRHVGLDPDGVPCLWLQVLADNDTTDLVVYIVGTGRPIPTEATRFLGTFVQGLFVWHVYASPMSEALSLAHSG